MERPSRQPPLVPLNVLEPGTDAGAHLGQRRRHPPRADLRLRHDLGPAKEQLGTFIELTWGGHHGLDQGRCLE